MQDETVDIEEEAAMKKVDVLTKKNEMISGTIQHEGLLFGSLN